MSKARQSGGVSALLVIVTMVLLMLALYTFNQGLQAISNGDLASSILFMTVMVFSFAMVALSVLRVRRGYGVGYLTPKVLSIVRCAQCSFKQIKAFAIGDYVFKSQGRCTQCGNETLFINGIYAEDLRKRPGAITG